MSPTRPRHVVTETDELAAALDAAAPRWPELGRAERLVRLALEGHRAASVDHERDRRRRLAALREHSGAVTGVYRRDELERLRVEWPA